MVFGNRNAASGAGMAHTHDPKTGERRFYGEFMWHAQGDDLDNSLYGPQPLTGDDEKTLERYSPELFTALKEHVARLEADARDMTTVDFVIEDGTLWILGSRPGQRSPRANLHVVTSLVAEGTLSEDDALLRLSPSLIEQLLHPTLAEDTPRNVLARGLPAGPGIASGPVVLSALDAVLWASRGKQVVLVRPEATADDIRGMQSADGMLTARGGMTSHTAVIARGLGKSCVVGCGAMFFDDNAQTVMIKGETFRQGDMITIDGRTGEVMAGALATVQTDEHEALDKVLAWADARRTLNIHTNADSLHDVSLAMALGAEGVGLCRTEHMFFESNRLPTIRSLLIAEEPEIRRQALETLENTQRSDFEAIFTQLGDRPMTIRLLDMPTHEFLPRTEQDVSQLAKHLGLSESVVLNRVRTLESSNPMLGFRGCRVGVLHPGLYTMQTRAIIDAALNVMDTQGITPQPRIMIPMVSNLEEMRRLRTLIDREANARIEARNATLTYHVGTMIELPRACLIASQIATFADFISFGTNDLTQTTWGISRDDTHPFLPKYVKEAILSWDPFQRLDLEGVGSLIEQALDGARKTRPEIHVGVCGEHSSEPHSVAFFHTQGFDHVSCSPHRIPVARLAAAQAAIRARKEHS